MTVTFMCALRKASCSRSQRSELRYQAIAKRQGIQLDCPTVSLGVTCSGPRLRVQCQGIKWNTPIVSLDDAYRCGKMTVSRYRFCFTLTQISYTVHNSLIFYHVKPDAQTLWRGGLLFEHTACKPFALLLLGDNADSAFLWIKLLRSKSININRAVRSSYVMFLSSRSPCCTHNFWRAATASPFWRARVSRMMLETGPIFSMLSTDRLAQLRISRCVSSALPYK
jgi:hypothetical protein